MEPEWRIAGQIIFENGKKCYFKYTSLDLNPQGSSEIAKDKDYANFFMNNLGFPTIQGKTFFSDQCVKLLVQEEMIKRRSTTLERSAFP